MSVNPEPKYMIIDELKIANALVFRQDSLKKRQNNKKTGEKE